MWDSKNKATEKYEKIVFDYKWCRPSVFIVNFEHHSHLFLVFSIGNFEQLILCYDIIFTSLYSDFVISSSLSIYTLKAQGQIWNILQGVSSQGVQFTRKFLAWYDE